MSYCITEETGTLTSKKIQEHLLDASQGAEYASLQLISFGVTRIQQL